MPRFTSTRERRLWLATVAVLVATYATVGLARPLIDSLRENGWTTVLFIIAMALAGATVLTQGLRVRPVGAEVAVALGVAAVYLLLFVRISIPADRTHLLEYSVVGVFVYEALRERSRTAHVPRVPLLAILISAALGVLDEAIQLLVPSRVFDPIDIGFNVLASTTAILGCAALGWVRQRVRRQTP